MKTKGKPVSKPLPAFFDDELQTIQLPEVIITGKKPKPKKSWNHFFETFNADRQARTDELKKSPAGALYAGIEYGLSLPRAALTYLLSSKDNIATIPSKAIGLDEASIPGILVDTFADIPIIPTKVGGGAKATAAIEKNLNKALKAEKALLNSAVGSKRASNFGIGSIDDVKIGLGSENNSLFLPSQKKIEIGLPHYRNAVVSTVAHETGHAMSFTTPRVTSRYNAYEQTAKPLLEQAMVIKPHEAAIIRAEQGNAAPADLIRRLYEDPRYRQAFARAPKDSDVFYSPDFYGEVPLMESSELFVNPEVGQRLLKTAAYPFREYSTSAAGLAETEMLSTTRELASVLEKRGITRHRYEVPSAKALTESLKNVYKGMNPFHGQVLVRYKTDPKSVEALRELLRITPALAAPAAVMGTQTENRSTGGLSKRTTQDIGAVTSSLAPLASLIVPGSGAVIGGLGAFISGAADLIPEKRVYQQSIGFNLGGLLSTPVNNYNSKPFKGRFRKISDNAFIVKGNPKKIDSESFPLPY